MQNGLDDVLQVRSCASHRQMGAKLAEAERLRAAGDAYKRELLQAKLGEREGELSAAQEKLRAAKREAASAPHHHHHAACTVLEAGMRGLTCG